MECCHEAHRKWDHPEDVAGCSKQLLALPPCHGETSEDALDNLFRGFDVTPQQLAPEPVVAPKLRTGSGGKTGANGEQALRWMANVGANTGVRKGQPILHEY